MQIELLNIPLSEIEFGDRARKAYKDLNKLVEDFRKKGIITPVAVQRQSGKAHPFLLLAGGRRFSAAAFGNFPTIPARVYPESMDDLDRREIELMENISREDLDWKEEVWLTEEIHRLQIAKHGPALGNTAQGHSANDTAKLLNVSAMSVSRDRTLAKALEDHSDILATAKNKSEALRLVRKLERNQETAQVAQRLQNQINSDRGDQLKRVLANGYLVGDFFEGVESVPDRAVQFVELDPPYAIELDKDKNTHESNMLEYSEIKANVYPAFLERVFRECYRVMFPDSWIVVWHGWQWTHTVVELLKQTGFDTIPIPAVWVKIGFAGQTNSPNVRLASCVEPFIYARKGSAVIRQPGRNNTFMFQPLHADHKSHPTERPIEMIQEIVTTFCPPGGHVMVPFLGSGNSLLAASNLGSTGFGWDLSDEYKNGYMRKLAESMPGQFKSYKTER